MALARRVGRRQATLAGSGINTMVWSIVVLVALFGGHPPRSTAEAIPKRGGYKASHPSEASKSQSEGRGKSVARGATGSFVAVGDVMFAGMLARPCRSRGFRFPLNDLAHWVRGADLALVNLECPLTGRGKAVAGKRWVFRAPAAVADALVWAGFDAACLANNHILDYGSVGLRDTLDACRKAGIPVVGAGMSEEAACRALVLDGGGMRFGILAYSKVQPKTFWARGARPGAASLHAGALAAAIRRLRPKVDHVIVHFHWGAEYTPRPSKWVRYLAKTCAEAGARLVVGGHPHTYGPVEYFGTMPVVYSLGNFAFGTSNPRAQVGLALRATFDRRRLTSLAILPLDVAWVRRRGVPGVMRGPRLSRWRSRWGALCRSYGTVLGAELSDGSFLVVPFPRRHGKRRGKGVRRTSGAFLRIGEVR